MRNAKTSTANLTEAAWNIADYNTTHQQAVNFNQELATAYLMVGVDRPVPVQDLQPSLKEYMRQLFKKKREAATHIMVVLASDEFRRSKPYSIPLQYLTYTSIRDQQIRDITGAVKERLLAAGVLVVGKFISL